MYASLNSSPAWRAWIVILALTNVYQIEISIHFENAKKILAACWEMRASFNKIYDLRVYIFDNHHFDTVFQVHQL